MFKSGIKLYAVTVEAMMSIDFICYIGIKKYKSLFKLIKRFIF